VDARTVEEPERWGQSAYVLCPNGCALDVGVRRDRIVGVRRREGDRANRGRLGPKGLHARDRGASRVRAGTRRPVSARAR
jgi:anaerobic selenocysteine-containing dehydrogenase